MGSSMWALALLAALPGGIPLGRLAPSANKPPEVVAIPLRTEGVKASLGLQAWKAVVAELDKGKKKLGASTSLQKKQHDFLIGPAREQARDCGDNEVCLLEIGATLGADLLVTGRVDKDGVQLVALDVQARQKIGEASSAPKETKRGIKTQSKTAARGIVKVLKDRQRSTAVAAAPPAGGRKADDLRVDEGSTKAADPYGKIDGGDSGIALVNARMATLMIDKSQLAGVTTVTVDGEPIAFTGDGAMVWTGPPGNHTVVATRLDGGRATRSVVVDPGQSANVLLDFPSVTPPPPPPTVAMESREPVTSKWWFWTSVGVAVVAGSVTAVFLAGGEKGGPTLPAESGTIRGSY